MDSIRMARQTLTMASDVASVPTKSGFPPTTISLFAGQCGPVAMVAAISLAGVACAAVAAFLLGPTS